MFNSFVPGTFIIKKIFGKIDELNVMLIISVRCNTLEI
jgi:hypothetical protein